MENAEEIFQCLDEFSKRKPKTIPRELDDYLAFVARTGDPVYQWSLIKCLFKEKLLNVITEFYETSPGLDIPQCPNVDPFSYDTMKNSLLERIDTFSSAPFTVQRICELLTAPRKQYNRIDKFMRAVEKNILVVSTREPGLQRHTESENGEQVDSVVNGSDSNSDYNVDVEMEDMSWKDNAESQQPSLPQASSSEININTEETKLSNSKDSVTIISKEKQSTSNKSEVSPSKITVASDKSIVLAKSNAQDASTTSNIGSSPVTESEKMEIPSTEAEICTPEVNTGSSASSDVCKVATSKVPEIKVVDTDMSDAKSEMKTSVSDSIENKTTELSTKEEKKIIDSPEDVNDLSDTTEPLSPKNSNEDSNLEPAKQESIETKLAADILNSGDDSSSSNSSENLDGNSNSPCLSSNDSSQKSPEGAVQPSSASSSEENSTSYEGPVESSETDIPVAASAETKTQDTVLQSQPKPKVLESDNYSITDVQSELTQSPPKEKQIDDNVPLLSSPGSQQINGKCASPLSQSSPVKVSETESKVLNEEKTKDADISMD